VARGAGYKTAHSADSIPDLIALKDKILGQPGPHFVELRIMPQPRVLTEMPQPELPDLQFQRMAAEARAMMQHLGTAG